MTKPEPAPTRRGCCSRSSCLPTATYDPEAGTCLCPAGKRLYQNGANCQHNGYLAVKFQGALRDCLPRALRDRCLRTPEQTKTRQVSSFRGKAATDKPDYVAIMKRAIDSPQGRVLYGGINRSYIRGYRLSHQYLRWLDVHRVSTSQGRP